MTEATVRWFDADRGLCSRGRASGPDVFGNRSQSEGHGFRSREEDQRVGSGPTQGTRGHQAAGVRSV